MWILAVTFILAGVATYIPIDAFPTESACGEAIVINKVDLQKLTGLLPEGASDIKIRCLTHPPVGGTNI